jgi:hypothetical protein
MDVYSVLTGKSWTACQAADQAAAEARNAANNARQSTIGFLTDVLTSDNLVVLTGLGTSMSVKGDAGQVLAPSMADLWTLASAVADDFNEILNLARYDPTQQGENVERLLSNCHVVQGIDPHPELATFIANAEREIVASCSFVTDDVKLPLHEAFIRVLARRSPRKPRLRLFTLNYDLAFETAASRSRFVVIDGFSHTQPQQFDSDYFSYDIVRRDDDRPAPDYISNVFHLYKLHGSVDWNYSGAEVTRTPTPTKPAIIYPRYTKFEASYNPPFLELVSRFQSSLRQPNTGLLVAGFGFNDEHITQPILAAFRSNVSLKAAIVSRSIREDPDSATGRLLGLVNAGDRRVLLAKATFEELVPMLPDLIGPTESELHAARLRTAGVQ